MADQKINELPTKTAPSTGDKMLMIGTAEEYQIDYDKLASAILDKLATKQYSELDTTAKTVLGALDELNSKSYLLRGGTVIPENADLDDYGTIGNYYCNSSAVAGTLTHSPFSTAFTMKAELSAGTSYACQTAIKYNTGQKAWRYNKGSSWTNWVYFSDDATVLGQTITYSTYTIHENQTMTIEENNNSFYQLIVFRGNIGSGYNAVLLTGYGIGTDSRYHYKLLDDGRAISISISDTSFVIKNEAQSGLIARIFNLYGNSPAVSIS